MTNLRRTSYFVHPFSPEGTHEQTIWSQASAVAGVWSSSLRIHYFPIVVPSACRVYRMFWLNGTAATDALQVGVYEDTAAGPGRLIGAAPPALASGSNVCQFVSASNVTGAVVTANSSSTDGTSFTTASVTLRKGRMYTLGITNSHATTAHAVSSVDNGPTFTSRATVQHDGTLKRESLFTAVPTQDYTGTLVINFGANTETGCAWRLVEWHNVDTATNDGIVQTATNTGTGTTYSATLAAFGSANNATYGQFGWNTINGMVAGTGFFEAADLTYTLPNVAYGFEWRPDNSTTVDATCSVSSSFGAIAAEIKAAMPDSFALSPGRYWIGIVCSGTTTSILRITSASATNRHSAGYIQNIGSGNNGFYLPATATPASPSNATQVVPIAGFTTIASP